MKKCLIAAQKMRLDGQLVCDLKLIGFDGGRNVFLELIEDVSMRK